MSRYCKALEMSATISSAVRAAFGDARAKRLARELGCSIITAKRIAASGQVSGRLRLALIHALLRGCESKRAELDRVEDELRRIEYQEKVAAISSRHAALDAARDEGRTRPADGADDAAIARQETLL